jgi:transposase-like protein
VAASPRPGPRAAPDPQHLPLRLPQVLGSDGRDLRPVYTAATEAATEERFAEYTATWGTQYPAIVALWRSAWSDFVPFLDYDVEIRKVICSTNAIESINA